MDNAGINNHNELKLIYKSEKKMGQFVKKIPKKFVSGEYGYGVEESTCLFRSGYQNTDKSFLTLFIFDLFIIFLQRKL